MKFSTKLSLSFTALLAAGLCAVGLVMVGFSFADGLASASATASTGRSARPTPSSGPSSPTRMTPTPP